jgi:hypothetical protein
MPFTTNGRRDYKRELAWEKKNKPNRVKDRAKRNAARSVMEKEGKVKKGDGKQVDHLHALLYGGSNKRSNLKAVSDKTNLTKEAMRKRRAAKGK